MAKILDTKSLYYNDVNLIAQPSLIKSRSEVPVELNRIIVSPMESIMGEKFALEANKLGLTVCLHRFCDVEKQASLFTSLSNKKNVFVSVGINDIERVKILAKYGAHNFLLDIANGYIPHLKQSVYEISNYCYLENIMVGNIMTGDGFYNATFTGFNTFVRVGIAGGAACSTSDATGYNRGQITELLEIKEQKDKLGYTGVKNYIVADGGIKNGNYAAKAFGAGADYVMMGKYFSQANEAETHVIGDGTYWGGASYKQQERWGGVKKHSEGKIIPIEEEVKSLELLTMELWGGLSSAVSYSGYKTLSEFIGNGVFEIKQNSLPPKR